MKVIEIINNMKKKIQIDNQFQLLNLFLYADIFFIIISF